MVIHLTGPDTYRSRARLHQLRDAFIAKHDQRGFSTVFLDGLTATKAEIRAALTGGGLFTTKTFVAINGFESAGTACSRAELAEVLEPAVNSADVIVVVREVGKATAAKKPARGKKVVAAAAGLKVPGAKREEFPALSPAESKTWLLRATKARGGTLSAPVAELLVAACDNDPWRMAMEAEKLITLAGGRTVTVEDVNAMVVSAVSSDIFSLTDAIGGRARAQALHVLQKELSAGVHPLALITMIARHVRTLRYVQQAVADGMPRSQMAAELGLHPFVVSKALGQVARFSADDLQRLHHQLLETDYALKSTPLDAEVMLEVLVAGA